MSLIRIDSGKPPNLGTWFNNTPGWPPSSTVATGNLLYASQVFIPAPATITGIQWQVAATNTGNVRSALYDAAGTRVANRTTDFDVTGASTYTNVKVAFDATLGVTPGVYFVALIFSTTATFYGGMTSGPTVQAAQGGFTTPSTISVPTTAAQAPIMGTY